MASEEKREGSELFFKGPLAREAASRFPIAAELESHLAATGDLLGKRIIWHCHLTGLTALVVRSYIAGGAILVMSECNPSTSEADAIDCMRALGATIYTGVDSAAKALRHYADIIADTGFDLISAYLRREDSDKRRCSIFGATEITTSGIKRLREEQAGGGLPFPVINLNDGQIKSSIENFHGVGGGLVEALERLSASGGLPRRDWRGARATVTGYGAVGAGVCHYLKRAGLEVKIVERDPVRLLKAVYDGFIPADLETAAKQSDLIVTATGAKHLLGSSFWKCVEGEIAVINVGHWARELDLDSLRELSSAVERSGEQLERFILDDSTGRRSVTIACAGNPANIVLLTGSIEPTLIHLTTEALALAYIARKGLELEPGEQVVPQEVEELCATMALKVKQP